MSADDNGGPAFPDKLLTGRSHYDQDACRNVFETVGSDGMTLRDYFAAHAPAVPSVALFPLRLTKKIVIKDKGVGPNRYHEEWVEDAEFELERAVRWSWAYADMMLAGREK